MSSPAIDRLSYSYYPKTNKLQRIDDATDHLLTQLERLNRRTIVFFRSMLMLGGCIDLAFWQPVKSGI
jgi:IS1 family transposase